MANVLTIQMKAQMTPTKRNLIEAATRLRAANEGDSRKAIALLKTLGCDGEIHELTHKKDGQMRFSCSHIDVQKMKAMLGTPTKQGHVLTFKYHDLGTITVDLFTNKVSIEVLHPAAEPSAPKKTVNATIPQLMKLVEQWVWKGSPDVYSSLGAQIDSILQALNLDRLTARQPTLYRSLEVSKADLGTALSKGTLNMRSRDYSSWTPQAQTTSKYLTTSSSYGVVVSHRPTPSEVLVDLLALAQHISKDKKLVGEFSSSERLDFFRLREDLDDENEVILKNVSTSIRVAGLVSADPKFTRLLDKLDIEYEEEDSGIYVTLHKVVDHLSELKLR